ncbi:MAG: hypothetical protein HYT50_02640 [Candidatus Wildermuthbacteria bacterium]|nr:hypothetical protein [Candidatus Wildermuthbacteria bacterium]
MRFRFFRGRMVKIHTAALLLVALFVSSLGYVFVPRFAGASAMTGVKDTLTTPVPSASANHTIVFTLASGETWAAGETLTATFESGFSLAALASSDPLDYDIQTDTGGTPTEETLVAAGSCASSDAIEITSISGQVITFTACTSYTAPPNAAAYEIQIGTNAASGGTGNSQIANPGTAGSYDIDLAGTIGSTATGTAMVAVIAALSVTVNIDESLSFSVSGQTASQCANYNDVASPNEVATTASAIPFSSVLEDAFYDACQALTVSTNAASGYSVTIKENDQLTGSGYQIPDGNCDGACTDSSEGPWATASNNGFGYCMEDVTGNGAATADSGWGTNGCDDSTTHFKTIADTGSGETAQTIMSSASAVAGDISDVGFRLSVDASQGSGNYSNTVTYVATGNF